MTVADPTKAHYRGLEIDAGLARLIRHMPSVDATRERLQALQGVWDSLAMLSELSGTGVEIDAIRAAFSTLTTTLVNDLGHQVRHKAALAQAAKAQVTIDILVRNLFERTADIGFLATDEDLRRFAASDAATRSGLLPALRQRLREYQRKYSVYEDIVLLAPDGEVLARLDDGIDVPRTRDSALLEEALRGAQPCVEAYRAIDLCPSHPRSLIYGSRVTAGSGSAVGVLCLVFRFEDECERIFRKFVGLNDWSVVALLDGQGRAIASSDPFQVPVGARVGVSEDGRPEVMRFAGRQWLAVSCAPHGFQGYAGPGWRGHAMTPLEHAFATDEDGAEALDAPTAARLHGSRVLYPQALREIAAAARRIESDLARAVWNGNLALAGRTTAGSHDLAFSRALLREIGRTGARTREGFTEALGEMTGSVAAATLAGAHSRAALAIDILDRSLYERANDCRWWALTTRFRAALEAGGTPDAEALGTILRAIHGLYTVYANLVLFDGDGRVVAVSHADAGAAPGRRLDAEWVARTLALRDTQAYAVSAFEPTALYGGQSTWIYAAAVRGLADSARVVGGIAIVFDAAPQLRSMLEDTLPRDAEGRPREGAFGVFLDRGGRVIACSHAAPAVGEALDADASLRGATAQGARALAWGGRWYAVGAGRSVGYREFKGRDDPYREEVTALVLEALTDAGGDADPHAQALDTAPPPRSPGPRGTGERVDLATVRIGRAWHALPGHDVREALRADRLLPLPKAPAHVRGSVMFDGLPIAVLDIAALLGETPVAAATGQVVVLQPRSAAGLRFGLLVEALGDNPVVGTDQLVRLAERTWQRGPGGTALIDTVVAPAPGAPGGELLTLLSCEALARLLRGA